jgi:hypothetical protein
MMGGRAIKDNVCVCVSVCGLACDCGPEIADCYGRLAVVSDLDDGGFALNVDKELRGSAVL